MVDNELQNIDFYSITILGLLLAIGLLYVEYYLDFNYIFALPFESNTIVSVIYLFVGFLSLAFWTMALGFILTARFNIPLNNILNYEEQGSKLKDPNFKLYKAENYSYRAISCLFICFVLTIALRPNNYVELKNFLFY